MAALVPQQIEPTNNNHMQENSPASAQHKKVIKTKIGDHKSVLHRPILSEKMPTGISINVVINEEGAKTAVAKA